uniref:Uncharacterized protein n=1 Tax=Anopheles arabiensis TaxID=7173 RepID=A0A182HI93_ANOAR
MNGAGGQYWYNGLGKCLQQRLSIKKMPRVKPMTVAIFCRAKKPDSLEQYLRPLVNDLNNLIDKGIAVGNNDTTVNIKLRAIIADSPARIH